MTDLAWLPAKFRPIRPLGKGGMGEVWLVEEIAPGASNNARALACKFLKLDLPDDERESARLRFKREYLVLSKLIHPGLTRAHELFEMPGAIAYTMDFVEGWTLKDYFLEGHWTGATTPTPLYFTTRAGVERVIASGAELLGMLAWLHGSGIIHRDLKPPNLMVEKSGKLRMIDFGLARGEHEVIQLTGVGDILGTPNYIAPEQIRGQRLDGRSDLYAVGVILYELLAGKPPFSGTAAQVLMAHLGQAPKPPRELNALIMGPLSGYILRLLAKTPQARFSTAEEARHGLLSASGQAGNTEVTAALEAPGPIVGRGLLLTTPYEGNPEAVAAMTDICATLHEQGCGSLTLLSGSAGSGKSRLLDELKSAAVERGVKVLCGSCHEDSAGQLFNEMFRPLAEQMARDPERAAKWLDEDAALLAHHFPVLCQIPGLKNPKPPELQPSSAKAQLMGAMYKFFSRLAREDRVILAAEDLHWADTTTLELLAHLTRSFALAEESESPLALVVNYRPEEVAANPALEKWLAVWKGGRVARLRLKPLNSAEVAELIRNALGDPFPPGEATLTAICDLTGGNPFFVLELLRRGREEEARHVSGNWSLGRWLREDREALPESLSAALKRRLADLGEKAQEPLEAAAILGRAFDFTLWREVSGVTEDELFELAERAFKLEILAEVGTDRLQFQHELFRRQLLQGMSGMKQRRLHGKTAKTLIARPEAKDRHSATIARHAVAAGMKAEAAAFGLPALNNLDRDGEFEQGWALLEGIGALFTAAEPMAPADEIEWQRLRGKLLTKRGSAAEAAAILEQARERLRELPAGESRDLQEMKILTSLGIAYQRQSRYNPLIHVTQQRLAVATILGDVVNQCDSLMNIGVGLGYLGDLAGAEEHLARAESLLSKITDETARLRQEGFFANARSLLDSDQGRMAAAAQGSVKALVASQAVNDKENIAINFSNLGEVELHLGRLAEAKRRLEHARKLNEEIGARGGLPDNLSNLGLCAFHEDHLDEAEALLQQSLRLAGETANRYLAAFARIYLARILAEKGDREGAHSLLDEASAAADEMKSPAIQAKVHSTRAAIELRDENWAAAQSAAARTLEISAGRFANDEALARAVAAAARLHGGVGPVEFSALSEQLRESIVAALKLENTPLEFELRLIAAESLHAAGHSPEALFHLADTPARARATGFIRFANRADKIKTAAQAAR